MKNFYRIFCCIIVLLTVINISGFGAAYAEDGISDADAIEKMEILKLLDIIPDYSEYNADMNKEITRADFVSSLARIINLDEYEEEYIYYYDVPQTHWAYNAICALTEMKVLNGAGDKLFHPDNPITKTEAYKMALGMLGYSEYAEANGGFPGGYIITARKTKIDEGVSSSEYVTLRDMFTILYNTMNTDLFEAIVYSDDGNKYSVSENKTLLTVYRDVYYAEGIVQGADCITAAGDIIDAGCVLIDGELYDTGLDLMQYFGEMVKYFYYFDESTDKREILWVSEEGSTKKLYVKADNDAEFDEDSFKLKYYDESNGKNKEIYIERGATVIFNGGLSEKKVSDIFNIPKYTAKLVKSTSGKYDIAVIDSYENIVVDKIDNLNKTVYDKNNSSKKLILDESEYEKLSIEMSDKKEISFEEIKNGYVLSYYMSEDKNYLKVRISNEQSLGIVDEITDESNGQNISIGGTKYFLPGDVSVEPFSVGDNVLVYTDVNNEIAYLEIEGKNRFVSYLINNAKGNAFESVQFKLLTDKEEILIKECSKKVELDGVVYNKQDEIFEYFRGNGTFIPQIAMITLNSDGAISSIDTVIHNTDKGENSASLTINVPYTSGQEFRHTGIIGAKSVINENTVIFSVPLNTNEAEDDEYQIVSRYDIEDKEYLNAETYKTAEKVGYEQYVVLKGFDNEEFSTDAVPVLVSLVGSAINEDGAAVECIHGYQGNTEICYLADDDFKNIFTDNDIQEGSLIWLKFNRAGYVEDLRHLYSYTDPDVYKFDSGIDSEYRTTYAYVNDIVDGILKIGYNDPAVIDQVMITEGIPVLVFDSENSRNPINVGNINDALTYYNEGEGCSKIVMVTKWRNPKVFVICR